MEVGVFTLTNYEKIKSMSVDELARFLESTNNQMAIKVGGGYIVRDKRYIQIWLESETEPNFCTDKQNKLVHCENCHEECEVD